MDWEFGKDPNMTDQGYQGSGLNQALIKCFEEFGVAQEDHTECIGLIYGNDSAFELFVRKDRRRNFSSSIKKLFKHFGVEKKTFEGEIS